MNRDGKIERLLAERNDSCLRRDGNRNGRAKGQRLEHCSSAVHSTDALHNLRDFKRHTVKSEAQSGRNRIRSQRQVQILWFQDVIIRLFDVWSSEVRPSEASILGDVNGEAQVL